MLILDPFNYMTPLNAFIVYWDKKKLLLWGNGVETNYVLINNQY